MTDSGATVAAYTVGLVLMLGYAVYLWRRCVAIRARDRAARRGPSADAQGPAEGPS